MEIYRSSLGEFGGYLTEDGDLVHKRVAKMMNTVGALDDRIFKARTNHEKNEVDREKRDKFKPCNDFRRGLCTHGARCRFSHDIAVDGGKGGGGGFGKGKGFDGKGGKGKGGKGDGGFGQQFASQMASAMQQQQKGGGKGGGGGPGKGVVGKGGELWLGGGGGAAAAAPVADLPAEIEAQVKAFADDDSKEEWVLPESTGPAERKLFHSCADDHGLEHESVDCEGGGRRLRLAKPAGGPEAREKIKAKKLAKDFMQQLSERTRERNFNPDMEDTIQVGTYYTTLLYR